MEVPVPGWGEGGVGVSARHVWGLERGGGLRGLEQSIINSSTSAETAGVTLVAGGIGQVGGGVMATEWTARRVVFLFRDEVVSLLNSK